MKKIQFENQNKKKTIGMLKALIKKVENGEFLVVSHGFWKSGLDEKLIFRVDVLTKDALVESAKLEQFS